MAAKVTVRIENWPKVRALLSTLDPIYALPWTEAMGEASEMARKALEMYAPGSDHKDKIKAAVQKRPVPLWARARMPSFTRGRDRKGRPFRVFGALHGSVRIKYRFRVGQFAGQLTYGWFDRARDYVMDRVWPLLTKAERAIESRWNRG